MALAKVLPGRFRSLYIITSSVPAALELSKAAYEILLVGGQVRNHSLALIGPVAVKTISQYHDHRGFLGTSGISLTHGHSTPNPFDGEVKQAMIRSADESYVLTDSSKFGHTCLTSFASLEEVHLTITDYEISAEFHKALSKRNIGLQIIDPEGKIPDSTVVASPSEASSQSGLL